MWRVILSQMGGACTGIICIMMTYVSYLANAGYGIAVAVAGILITCINIFDGITDPIIANIVDRVNTKHGKIRLLMGIGWAGLAFILYLMFNALATGRFGAVTFVLLYALYIVFYTLFDITNRIIPPVLTNDPKQRPVVGVWNTILTYMAPMATMMFFTIVLLPKHGNEYNLPMLKECVAIVIVASGITLLLSMIGVSHVDKPESFEGLSANREEKVSFKDMWAMLKENKALQTFMWAVTSDRIAIQTSGVAVVTTITAGILMRNMAMANIFGTVIMFASMIFTAFGARYTGKHGSRKSMVFWTILCMILAAITFVFYLSIDMSQIYSVAALTVVNTLLSFLLSGTKMACSTSVSSMMSDIVDYQMYETGKYMPAAVTATYSFIDKIVGAFSSTIALGLISLVGYRTVMPQPNDPATPGVFWIAMFISIGMPMIGWIITLLAMKKSPLSREKMVEVQKYIAAHKAEIEAAQSEQ